MKNQLTVLDLFSGIGGFSLGLEQSEFRTIAFCEIEKFCQKVLRKHWPHIPIAQDIHELTYKNGILYDSGESIYRGKIDVICGGFPCQPFSIAGRKKGTADDRDLWPQMFRIIQQAQPTWIVGENVTHFTKMAFFRTKADLESEGYTVQPFIIPACAIGAPHKRDRLWIIAHSKSKRCDRRRENGHSEISKGQICQGQQDNRKGIRSETTADAELCSTTTNIDLKRVQGIRAQSLSGEQAFSWCKNIRGVEDYFNRPDIPQPLICRGGDGFSSRVDRLRALGNSVVPQIPEIIGKAILTNNKDNNE